MKFKGKLGPPKSLLLIQQAGKLASWQTNKKARSKSWQQQMQFKKLSPAALYTA